MINANELRIGNWVMVTLAVMDDISDEKSFHYRQVGVNDFYKTELLDPIPISPDILLSAGFEVDTKQEHWHYYRKRIVNDGVREKTLSIEYGVPTETFYFRALKGTRMETKIKTVHHLQNLVHSITGTEITINI